jgi:hypothetical protein
MISTDYDANAHAGLVRATRAGALALASLIVVGCGGQSEADLRSANSWSLTAVLVARYWAEGDVPTAYARRTLRKARDELRRGPLPQAADPVEELLDAVRRGQRDTARELAREISGR